MAVRRANHYTKQVVKQYFLWLEILWYLWNSIRNFLLSQYTIMNFSLSFGLVIKFTGLSCGHGCADWESRRLRGVRYSISFSQADEILGYLAEEASYRVELFCCTTMHIRIPPGSVGNSIETSSSITRTFRTWHLRTFSCFLKWRSTLLANAPQTMKTWRMRVE